MIDILAATLLYSNIVGLCIHILAGTFLCATVKKGFTVGSFLVDVVHESLYIKDVRVSFIGFMQCTGEKRLFSYMYRVEVSVNMCHNYDLVGKFCCGM
jgi:hypothetical protein